MERVRKDVKAHLGKVEWLVTSFEGDLGAGGCVAGDERLAEGESGEEGGSGERGLLLAVLVFVDSPSCLLSASLVCVHLSLLGSDVKRLDNLEDKRPTKLASYIFSTSQTRRRRQPPTTRELGSWAMRRTVSMGITRSDGR